MTRSLPERLLASGQSPEYPDRDADHHAQEDDLGDQEHNAYRDTNEREKEYPHDLPQQDGDCTGGGDAENGLQNGQAPLEAATLREFIVKGVKPEGTLSHPEAPAAGGRRSTHDAAHSPANPVNWVVSCW
jgi:hypothetical protein